MRGYPKKADSNGRSINKTVVKRLWDVSESMRDMKYRF